MRSNRPIILIGNKSDLQVSPLVFLSQLLCPGISQTF